MNLRKVFVVAMDNEAAAVTAHFEGVSEETVFSRRVIRGTLDGEPTALVVAGIGKSNAAAAAQLALCLGELILLPGQIQLILTLIGNIHGGLAGGIHKLHTLFLNLVEIKFKHEKHLFFHSFVAAFPKALCCSLLFAL